ncbi:glutamate binding protein [Coprinopsis cinerea okayama7|uniref:Glutamate binding protein n=1 Tax=Coprinopsis cinerea (strain Okayama-7 / 130 / ATCC MYA-4618 / FGSC 9003) TaxID=240176 RepID=A8N7C0_COPC7|nr:glutamate binding protein [Coprinopsis cinerea okayama7\|eukprot:XP_001830726.1 glutamate binding protein [Coprinopsis cinerea okayama7\
MSQYPVPPPTYGSTSPKPNYHSVDDTRDPLLGGSSQGGYYNQPAPGELPDDFKYGVSVSESAPEIRAAFVRKVYSILLAQIFATCVVGGLVSSSPSAILWVQANPWSFYVPLFGTLINLGLLYWKRHSHPWNFVFLSTFTLMEAFTLGIVTAFYDDRLVMQALLITLGIFLGLTLFTFQSKYDFSGMGPFLFGTLMALLFTGLISIFFPFNRTFDIVYACVGILLFSGYIVYDTYMINKRLSPDEYIMGAISLYLDFINLFINILRLLGDLQER